MNTFQKLVLRAILIILVWCEKQGGLAPVGHGSIKDDIRKALGKDAP